MSLVPQDTKFVPFSTSGIDRLATKRHSRNRSVNVVGEKEVSSMRAGILLFRPSVLFFALALVVFVTMVALTAGESSAQQDAGRINDPECDPSTTQCFSGGGLFKEGPGGQTEGGTSSGGGTLSNPETGKVQGVGGRLLFGEGTEACVLSGTLPGDRCP